MPTVQTPSSLLTFKLYNSQSGIFKYGMDVHKKYFKKQIEVKKPLPAQMKKQFYKSLLKQHRIWICVTAHQHRLFFQAIFAHFFQYIQYFIYGKNSMWYYYSDLSIAAIYILWWLAQPSNAAFVGWGNLQTHDKRFGSQHVENLYYFHNIHITSCHFQMIFNFISKWDEKFRS